MKNLIYLFIVLSLFSCKKAEERECMKAAGKTAQLELPLESFSKLRIGAKMKVTLVPSTENKMVVIGGENIIQHISCSMGSDGWMELKNNNRCNFLRNYKKNEVSVEIHFTTISELFFEGTYDLETRGTIQGNSFKMTIQDSGATAYLSVDVNELVIVQGHGYGDFVINGNCHNANIKITSNGFGDTKQLTVANELVVISNTPVASDINVEGAATIIEIGGSGNVRYYGNPSSLAVQRYGTGNAIQMN